MTGQFVTIPGTNCIALADDAEASRTAVMQASFNLDPTVMNACIAAGLKPGDHVLDIGAFIGYTTRAFLEYGCQVTAFEAQPDAFMCLKHNCPGATIYNAAVGDGRRVGLSQDKMNGNSGTRQVKHQADGNKTLRIDDLLLERVDFIKLDVEGFEPAVLAGMQDTLRRCRPKLLIEVYRSMLQSQGFSVWDIVNELPNYHFTIAIGLGHFDCCDVLAVPR